MKTNAKYGDESVYFDLSDVEATTGSWDVYGVDASSRYPDQQAAFFEYAAQGLGRREAVYSLLAVSAGLLTVGYGVKGAKDAKLPITVGPAATGRRRAARPHLSGARRERARAEAVFRDRRRERGAI